MNQTSLVAWHFHLEQVILSSLLILLHVGPMRDKGSENNKFVVWIFAYGGIFSCLSSLSDILIGLSINKLEFHWFPVATIFSHFCQDKLVLVDSHWYVASTGSRKHSIKFQHQNIEYYIYINTSSKKFWNPCYFRVAFPFENRHHIWDWVELNANLVSLVLD